MSVKAIPEGYHTITPYLMVNDAEAVIDFLKAAFGAEVVCITNGPVALDGKRMIGNAEVRVGTSMIMLADARPDVPSQKSHIALYHMGVYASPTLMELFGGEYPAHSKTKLDMGKSCIRFKKVDNIPYALIGELCSKMTPQEWIDVYEEQVKKR